MRSFILAFCVPILLAACSIADLSTMYKLSRVDPLTADPADYQVIVTLPDGMTLVEGATLLKLRAQRGEEVISDSFDLASGQALTGRVALRIAPEDQEAMRRFQATAKAWEEEDADSADGSISLDLDVDCLPGQTINPADLITIDIVMEQGGAPLPLLKPTSVAKYVALLNEEEEFNAEEEAEIQACLASG